MGGVVIAHAAFFPFSTPAPRSPTALPLRCLGRVDVDGGGRADSGMPPRERAAPGAGAAAAAARGAPVAKRGSPRPGSAQVFKSVVEGAEGGAHEGGGGADAEYVFCPPPPPKKIRSYFTPPGETRRGGERISVSSYDAENCCSCGFAAL